MIELIVFEPGSSFRVDFLGEQKLGEEIISDLRVPVLLSSLHLLLLSHVVGRGRQMAPSLHMQVVRRRDILNVHPVQFELALQKSVVLDQLLLDLLLCLQLNL